VQRSAGFFGVRIRLRRPGVALLVVVFVRLAFNPAVLSYHPVPFPIFNWYLYTFGIATICLFAAARFLVPPHNRVLGYNALPLLYTLGTILSFLIVNIEIADYFNTPGTAALTFQFSGNFARDMTYSIAWGLFALLLLIVGMRRRTARALRRSRITRHHGGETFLPRSFSARSTLSNWRVHRCRRDRNRCIVYVSAVPRRSFEK
jgi:uncharacterized membrane protein